MKLKSSYRYFMGDLRLAMIIFYSIQIGITLLIALIGLLLLRRNVVDSFSANNGMDIASCIFLLAMGLANYKESLLMHGQNGVSRRTFFLGRLLSAATAAAVMTTIDLAITNLIRLTFSGLDVGIDTLIGSWNQPFLLRVFACLLAYFFFITLGNALSALFYRLSKLGRILVGAGVPVLLFVVFPLLDGWLTDSRLSMAVLRFLGWAFGLNTGNAYMPLVSTAVLTVLMCASGWLLVRRAPAVSK